MSLIRTIHFKKYSETKRRFTSDVFKNFHGGISVFDSECATGVTPLGPCAHIIQFYNSTVGNPIAFWKIDADQLIDYFKEKGLSVELKPSQSTTGDECHYDIQGLNDKDAKRFYEAFCKPPCLYVCENGSASEILSDDYGKLALIYQSL